jgi:hypothetical protein
MTCGAKTLDVTRVLDRVNISISIHVNGFYEGGYIAVSDTFA